MPYYILSPICPIFFLVLTLSLHFLLLNLIFSAKLYVVCDYNICDWLDLLITNPVINSNKIIDPLPVPIILFDGAFLGTGGIQRPPLSCFAGHYCPPGTMFPTQYKCPVGTWSGHTGLETEQDCRPCPQGWYCLAGSGAPSGRCNSGHYCPEGDGQITQWEGSQTAMSVKIERKKKGFVHVVRAVTVSHFCGYNCFRCCITRDCVRHSVSLPGRHL